MDLIRITITKFKSFVKPVTFELQRSPGLVLVTGRNEVDPELGANGCGKTSLFNAVNFALYGETGIGERGPRVVSDGVKGPAILELDGRVDKTDFQIIREQSPNSLTLVIDDQSRTVVQQDVDDFIKVTKDEFTRGCYHVQGTIGFVGLKPQGMLDEFSSYLNLDVYDNAQQTANQRWVVADNKRRLVETGIEHAKVMVAEFRTNVDSLSHKAHEEARAKLRDARANAVAGKAARVALEAAQRCLAGLARGEPREDVEAQKRAVEALVAQAQKAEREADRTEKRYIQELSDLDRLMTETKCPTCGQTWDRSDEAKSKQKLIKKELRNAVNVLDEATRKLWAANEKREKLQIKIHETDRDSVEDLARTETEIKHLTSDVDRLKQEGMLIARRTNPALESLRQMEQSLQRTENDLIARQGELAAATEESAHYGYWRKGFKLLKLEVISKTVAQFQAVADDNLASLGMDNWSLLIDADSALDGKGKLKVQLMHASGASRSPDSLSFGENQRVKIAVDLAVGDVCLAARGVTTNIEMWDEPMTWLSANGITMFLEMLERRAATLGKTIYVSDHRTLDYDWSDVITINRDAKGSRIG